MRNFSGFMPQNYVVFNILSSACLQYLGEAARSKKCCEMIGKLVVERNEMTVLGEGQNGLPSIDLKQLFERELEERQNLYSADQSTLRGHERSHFSYSTTFALYNDLKSFIVV